MSWEKVKLGDIAIVTSSKRFHLSERSDSGVPFYCSKQIIQKVRGELVSDYDYIREEFYENVKKQYGVPEPGDLLITTRGSYGVPYIYKDNDKFYFADGNLTWLKDFKEDIDVRFLYYWICSHEGQKKIDAIAKGTAQKAVTIDGIKNLEISVPSFKTQKRIADILSAYDNLIENNQKQIKLLEEAAQRLYKQWFIDLRYPGHETTKIVDGLPKGWRKGCLADIVRDVGINEKKENRTNYSYYLPIDCLPKKSLTYTDFNNIELAESSLVAFSENDIVFGAMRPYFHKVVVARDPGLTRSTCFVINTLKQSMWSYAVMLLFDAETIKYATKISVGTTMPYVRWKDFISMPILIPHENVTKDFNRIICPIIDRLKKISKQNINLKQARDRLLPKLMNGELEI